MKRLGFSVSAFIFGNAHGACRSKPTLFETFKTAVACESGGDCGTGSLCLPGDDGAFCRAEGAYSSDCADGEGCELEDEGAFCEPHGGDNARGQHDKGAGGANACGSDANCATDEECENEHGGSFRKPHEGHNGSSD